MDKRALGEWGEEQAAAYLRKHGYTIVASRYRCRHGEVDLIAKKGSVLCFVEVKTRTNLSVGLPREYVDRRKQDRLRTTAALYLAQKELDCPVRFDVAEVYADEKGKVRIDYIENAFV